MSTADAILKHLAEILERAEKATPGEWDFLSHGEVVSVETGDSVCMVCLRHGVEDTKFIAAAKTDVPALARALRRAVVLWRGAHSMGDQAAGEMLEHTAHALNIKGAE